MDFSHPSNWALNIPHGLTVLNCANSYKAATGDTYMKNKDNVEITKSVNPSPKSCGIYKTIANMYLVLFWHYAYYWLFSYFPVIVKKVLS